MKKIEQNNKGFSLLELIIVIAVMVILIAFIVPQFFKYIERSRKAADLDTVDEVVGAIQTISADPDSADKVSEGDVVRITMDDSSVTSSAIEHALNEVGIRKERMHLKSKMWGSDGILIRVVSDGTLQISNTPDDTKGEYNIQNEYKK